MTKDTHYSAEMYAALDTEDKDTVDEMMAVAIAALHSGTGALVLLVDAQGNGVAGMYAAGNQLLIAPLLRSAEAVCDKVYGTGGGPLQ